MIRYSSETQITFQSVIDIIHRNFKVIMDTCEIQCLGLRCSACSKRAWINNDLLPVVQNTIQLRMRRHVPAVNSYHQLRLAWIMV